MGLKGKGRVVLSAFRASDGSAKSRKIGTARKKRRQSNRRRISPYTEKAGIEIPLASPDSPMLALSPNSPASLHTGHPGLPDFGGAWGWSNKIGTGTELKGAPRPQWFSPPGGRVQAGAIPAALVRILAPFAGRVADPVGWAFVARPQSIERGPKKDEAFPAGDSTDDT